MCYILLNTYTNSYTYTKYIYPCMFVPVRGCVLLRVFISKSMYLYLTAICILLYFKDSMWTMKYLFDAILKYLVGVALYVRIWIGYNSNGIYNIHQFLFFFLAFCFSHTLYFIKWNPGCDVKLMVRCLEMFNILLLPACIIYWFR